MTKEKAPKTKAATITIDGVAHEVSRFSATVQQAVGIYNAFQIDLQSEQLKVIKTQAALQNILAQISEAVKKELVALDAQEVKT